MATDNQKQVVVWKAPTTRLPSVGEFLPTLLPKQKVPVTPVVHNPNEVVTFEGKPVESYEICNRIFVMEKPENETRTTFTRATVGGRRLKYVLDVIQQPKKARACGNGPRCKFKARSTIYWFISLTHTSLIRSTTCRSTSSHCPQHL